MKFREYRDASHRLTVSLDRVPSLAYRVVRWKLTRHFNLKKSSPYIKVLEEKFQNFSGDKGNVSIDWDVWSGFVVTALNTESEPLVREIGDYLKGRYASALPDEG